MSRISKSGSLALAAFSAVAMGAPIGGAHAQQVGSYSGMTSNGTNVSISVTGSGGVFSIGNMNVGFTATCDSGQPTTEGWGFFLGQTIPGGGASMNFTSQNHYYYVTGKLRFSSNTKIKGNIAARTAVFFPHNPPAQSRFCTAANDTFTATYTGQVPFIGMGPGHAIVRQDNQKPPY